MDIKVLRAHDYNQMRNGLNGTERWRNVSADLLEPVQQEKQLDTEADVMLVGLDFSSVSYVWKKQVCGFFKPKPL